VIDATFVNFQCEAAPLTRYIHIQISKSHSFNDLIVNTISEGKGYSFPIVLLKPEATYFWRMQAQTFKGMINLLVKSEWTQHRKFRVKKAESFDDTIPSSPFLISPSDGATIKGLLTWFHWDTITNATYYRIQISDSQLFEKTIMDKIITVPYCESTFYWDINKKYYWKICAINSRGASEWSQVWSLKTSSPGPIKNDVKTIPPDEFNKDLFKSFNGKNPPHF